MKNGKDSTIRIGTWNTKWAKPGTPRGKIIRDKLAAAECDVLCVTEGFEEILPDRRYVVDAGEDWGCPIKKGQRKVLLWSKQPWTRHTHPLGLEGCRSHKGRFIAGATKTASGASLTVIGVCIPWRGSHVKFCKKDLKPFEDHILWLKGFRKLRRRFPMSRTVVLGDFNQTIPRTGAPKAAFKELSTAFRGFEFATEGVFLDCLMTIDHIAHTRDLHFTPSSINFWPKSAIRKIGVSRE